MPIGDKAKDDCGNEKTNHPPPSQRIREATTFNQAAIGARLRAFYDGLVDQPLPDRLVELMAKLDSSHG
jgi:Anti-sigma factor NepR